MAEIFLVLLLSAHLLLVDVAMAGPLACVALRWHATADEALSARTARALATLSIAALIAGGALGGVLLALRWSWGDGAYLSALAALPPSRLWFGGGEFLFSLAAMVAYRALWRSRGRWRAVASVLALAASTNLLAHFPALFTIVAMLAGRGADAPLTSADYRALLVDGEVVARVVHVWLSAVAVTAVLVIALARRLAREGDEDARDRLTRGAARAALAAVALELPSGLYVAFQLPESAQRLIFGGDPLASGFLIVGIALAFMLLHVLSAVALGDRDARHIRRSLLIVPLLVMCMVATRVHVYNRSRADIGTDLDKSLAKRLTP